MKKILILFLVLFVFTVIIATATAGQNAVINNKSFQVDTNSLITGLVGIMGVLLWWIFQRQWKAIDEQRHLILRNDSEQWKAIKELAINVNNQNETLSELKGVCEERGKHCKI